MNLLNKELIGISVAIVVLYAIQQSLPKKKKEGFAGGLVNASNNSGSGTLKPSDNANTIGFIVGGIFVFLVLLGLGYAYYKRS
jgi:hypothetical protein